MHRRRGSGVLPVAADRRHPRHGRNRPVWVSLLAAAFVPWAGRPIIETAPTAAHFLARRAQGQTRYAVRPDKPRPDGTLALPGDAAAVRWLSEVGTGAVMVHDPHQQTLTAVARVSHPAYVLLSPDEQSRRVQGWGRALAGLAASGTCARVQILESARPDSGRGITDWWGVITSFLALSATATALGVYPVAGVAILLGADRIMDSMRVFINLLGNCLATFVVAKSENALDRDRMRRAFDGHPDDFEDIVEAEAARADAAEVARVAALTPAT